MPPFLLLGLLALQLTVSVEINDDSRTAEEEEEVRETCQWETFKAVCPSVDQVIVMQRANYGRMRRGRCARKNFGYEGCVVNVLATADKLCSGQRQCKISVYETFGHIRPCSELESYLESSYTCVTVMYREAQCGWNDPAVTITRTTSVASWQRQNVRGGGRENDVGGGGVTTSGACFSHLRAQDGQRWKITLLDLTLSHSGGQHAQKNEVPLCTRYARVRETNHTDFVICGGYGRVRTVYESHTAALDIHFLANRENWVGGVPPRFIFRYEVVGCPLPMIPADAAWRRVGNEIYIACKSTDRKWSMRCYGNAWLGSDHNCSLDDLHQWTRWPDDRSTRNHDTVLIAMLAIAVGAMVGVSLIFIATATFSRQDQQQQQQQQQQQPNESIPLGIIPPVYGTSPVKTRPSPPLSPSPQPVTSAEETLVMEYGNTVGLTEGPLVRENPKEGATNFVAAGLWIAGGSEFVCLPQNGASSSLSASDEQTSSVSKLLGAEEHIYQTPI